MRVRRGSSGQEKEVKGAIVGRTAAKVRDLLANRSVGLRDHAYNLGFGKLRQEDYCKFEDRLSCTVRPCIKKTLQKEGPREIKHPSPGSVNELVLGSSRDPGFSAQKVEDKPHSSLSGHSPANHGAVSRSHSGAS